VTVEIWSSLDWQMSLGERAALEGLLSQLKPGLSVEIGTAAGGSLTRIAAHSDEVHTIDLAAEPGPIPANAAFHQGNSRVVLPELLNRFATDGRNVDFALVDGDHSKDGANADLTALLDSPAVARSLILVHDSANPGVRAGITTEHPKVAGWDLDFVPGRVAGPGRWEGQAWGGFALLVVAAEQLDGFGLWALRPQAAFFADPA
jgi:hypothetical protein